VTAQTTTPVSTAKVMSGPRLKVMYDTEIRTALKDQLELSNIMEVPRMSKIVVNMGVGAAVSQAKLLEGAIADMTTITGRREGNPSQRPHVGVLRPPRHACDSSYP
jgi:large subunit ribosomal protein L5